MDSEAFIFFTKDGQVKLPLQVITLTENQKQQLLNKASEKTFYEWNKSKQGVKIKLTEAQKQIVLEFKNTFVQYYAPTKTAEELLQKGVIRFAEHAFERINERLLDRDKEKAEKAFELKKLLGMVDSNSMPDYLTADSPEVLEKVLQAFIDSTDLDEYFSWKNHEFFSYKFKARFDLNVIGIVMVFSKETSLITVIVEGKN